MALAKLQASIKLFPSAIDIANPAINASPAPIVSTTSTSKLFIIFVLLSKETATPSLSNVIKGVISGYESHIHSQAFIACSGVLIFNPVISSASIMLGVI